MSYDLMVFDPDAAPAEPKAFMKWYSAQTEWTESHGYNDPDVPSERLRGWYREIIATFPPLNGPLSNKADLDNPKTTDYSVGRTVIYAAFGWPQAEQANKLVRKLAQKHSVGFFDVSSFDGAVWRPTPGGSYEIAFYTSKRSGLLHSHPLQWTGAARIVSKVRNWFWRGRHH